MTTSNSPLRALKAQADMIAKTLKAVAAGKGPSIYDPAGKIAAAMKRETFKAGIVMDDKVITVEIPWATIRTSDEAGIAEFILNHMRGQRPPVN